MRLGRGIMSLCCASFQGTHYTTVWRIQTHGCLAVELIILTEHVITMYGGILR